MKLQQALGVFFFEVKILIHLQELLKIRLSASGDQICFLFIANTEKIKTRPPSHRPPPQQVTESLTLYERLDNRNILILQNTNTSGRTYNYISVYYRVYIISLLVSIKHMQRSQSYLFSSFKCLMLCSSPDISEFVSTHGFFFSVHIVCIIQFHEVIDLTTMNLFIALIRYH